MVRAERCSSGIPGLEGAAGGATDREVACWMEWWTVPCAEFVRAVVSGIAQSHKSHRSYKSYPQPRPDFVEHEDEQDPWLHHALLAPSF
jgi:hypothetical protein